jgi:phosphomannomutase/phosphoglucomutase
VKVVIDGGNGCAGALGANILSAIGCDVIPLYCEPDGNFPHHFPDPIVEDNLRELQKKVQEEDAELGIAYDGDGDRLGVVDQTGKIIWPDRLMILFYREILPKYPGASCPIEVKCSSTLWDEVQKLGGNPQFCKTGHSLIKALMKTINAPFCGEMSGHMFFADEYFGYDDAIYASCRLVRIIAGGNRSLGELLSDVPEYPCTPELRIDCPDARKGEIVDDISNYFRARYSCIDVDGVRILFDDEGWGLVRKSNTSPKLILRFEAKTESKLKEIKRVVVDKLKEYPEVNVEGI